MKLFMTGLIFALSSLSSTQMIFMEESLSGKFLKISDGQKHHEYIVTGNQWNIYPDISQDKKQIAYIRGDGPTSLQLIIFNRETQKEKILTQKGFVLHPHFSRNVEFVLFSEKIEDINSIVKLNLKTNRKTIIKNNESAYFPKSFQDGQRIIYQLNKKDHKQIVIHDIIKNTKEVIAHGMAPSLSIDERYIAYTSKKDGHWNIYVYDRFEKQTNQITKDHYQSFAPVFHPDGSIYYVNDQYKENIFGIYKQNHNSWTQKLYEEKEVFVDQEKSFYAPQFSADTDLVSAKLPSISGPARSSFGVISLNERTYVLGGHQGAEHTYPPESFTGTLSVFDHLKKSWGVMAPRLYPSHGFQMGASLDQNSLYAFGGFAYEEKNLPKWKSLSVVEKYNINQNEWIELPSMPRKRSSNVAVELNGKIYLIGGWDSTPKFDNDLNGKFHDEIDVFDLKTESWSTLKTKLPLKRRAFSAFTHNNRIYLLGGISEGADHFALLDHFTEFDPISETFKELPKLPYPTFAPAAGSIKQKAFLFGGMFKTGKYSYEYVPHIYQFDFITYQWSHTGRYLYTNKGFSAVVPYNSNCLSILGGHSYDGNKDEPVKDFEKWCLNNI